MYYITIGLLMMITGLVLVVHGTDLTYHVGDHVYEFEREFIIDEIQSDGTVKAHSVDGSTTVEFVGSLGQAWLHSTNKSWRVQP